MPSPVEAREALQLLSAEAVSFSLDVLGRLDGSPEVVRSALLEATSSLIDYYADGSAALAADFYDEQRELARVTSAFTSEAVVADRTVKTRRAIAWASAPLFVDDRTLAGLRLSEVVQLETARPFRDTTLANSHRDPQAVGWRRITRAGGCKMCRMLADRGAVYRKETAHFATHPNCNCAAQPVFKTDVGEEADVIQYMASRRNRTPESRARLREFLDAHY